MICWPLDHDGGFMPGYVCPVEVCIVDRFLRVWSRRLPPLDDPHFIARMLTRLWRSPAYVREHPE